MTNQTTTNGTQRRVDEALRKSLGQTPKTPVALHEALERVYGGAELAKNGLGLKLAPAQSRTLYQADLLALAQTTHARALPRLTRLKPVGVEKNPLKFERLVKVIQSEIEELVEALGAEEGMLDLRVDPLFSRLLGQDGNLLDQTITNISKKPAEKSLLYELLALYDFSDNTLEEQQAQADVYAVLTNLRLLQVAWELYKAHKAQDVDAKTLKLTQLFAAILDDITDLRAALEASSCGPAEQALLQIIYKEAGKKEETLYLAEWLDWVQDFAAEDGPNWVAMASSSQDVLCDTLAALHKWPLYINQALTPRDTEQHLCRILYDIEQNLGQAAAEVGKSLTSQITWVSDATQLRNAVLLGTDKVTNSVYEATDEIASKFSDVVSSSTQLSNTVLSAANRISGSVRLAAKKIAPKPFDEAEAAQAEAAQVEAAQAEAAQVEAAQAEAAQVEAAQAEAAKAPPTSKL